MMKKYVGLAAVPLAMAMATAVSEAAILEFTVLEAQWDNPVGGTITFESPATGFGDSAVIRWGDGGADPQATDSGYNFDARETPFSEADETIFALGEFSHQNNVISNPSQDAISSVDLLLLTSFDYDPEDGSPVLSFEDVVFQYTFAHVETPNNAIPCPYLPGDPDTLEVPGGGNVNDNGCADLVTITASPDNFEINGLTLVINGFSPSLDAAEDGIFFSRFLSGEQSTNAAILSAAFAADSGTGVPVPATLVLVGAGLLGIGIARRRRG
jgi:hypothetical protein